MEMAAPPMLTPPNIEQSTNSRAPPYPYWEGAGWVPGAPPPPWPASVATGNPRPGSWDRWASGGSLSVSVEWQRAVREGRARWGGCLLKSWRLPGVSSKGRIWGPGLSWRLS